jgi:O-antigen ligase
LHWSTALAEATAGAVILRFALGLGSIDPGVRTGREREARRLLLVLVLWGIYLLAVCVSLLASGGVLTAGVGTLWRPFLFVAVLFTPLASSEVKRLSVMYLAAGLAAAAILVLINLVAGFQSPALIFTGLTTFADQVALLAVGIFATLALSPGISAGKVALALGGMFLMVVLFWTAERAPLAVLVFAGAVIVLLSRPRLLAVWGILVAILFFIAPSGLRARTDWVIRGNPIDRYVVWEEGIRQLPHASLFGAGPDSYGLLLSPSAHVRFANRPPASWHNDLLQTWLDSGPVAALSLAGLVLVTVIAACGTLLRLRRDRKRATRAIPGIMFLCLAALGGVGSVVSTAILGSLFWSMVGLTVREWISGTAPPAVTAIRQTSSYHAEVS